MKIFKIVMSVLLLGTAVYTPSTYISANAQTPNDTERIYSIVVDRFLNTDASTDKGVPEVEEADLRFGGDFAGIEENLEYISSMGFTAIHLSPVFEFAADDYLGYDVESYEEIDSGLGGAEGLSSLVEAAHEMNLEVIVDVPAVSADGGSATDELNVNSIYSGYIEDKDLDMLDLTDPAVQSDYQATISEFVDEFNIDGLSMMIAQDGVDADEVLPEEVKTYGFRTTEDVSATGFDHMTSETMRQALSESYATVNREVPELPESEHMLLADHWFSERFTSHAVEENMFPGTRVKQLMTYLYSHTGPISMLYGTEVAFNADDIPDIHPQMDLWTDQEIVEYMEHINRVYSDHKNAFTGNLETLHQGDGHYITRYHTNDVDFILNINDTNETNGVNLNLDDVGEGKVLSGMLIGDMIRASAPGEYIVVLDREETELYAIIEESGFNNGYIIASLLIFGGFAFFIFFAARKNKKYRANMNK